MKRTAKVRFAVTAIVVSARHDPEEYWPVASVGDRRHLAGAYLEQIVGKLRRAGLLEGVRGPAGGYRLAKPADQITVIDILEAVDDPLEKASCDKNRAVCDGEGECITFDLWESLNEEIRRFLKGISLKTLADKKKLKDQGLSPVSIIKPKV